MAAKDCRGEVVGERELANIIPGMAKTLDLAKKVEALREQIRHHEHRYYVLDDP